jgi:REP element-mobilizing transposase RayT
MWNDTNEPIAYLITFRTYGTWLHGDERGSIDKFHNRYEAPRTVASREREDIHRERLKSPPFLLDAKSRSLVEKSIHEVCEFRKWSLLGLAVRTNHVHCVNAATIGSGTMLNDFKAYSTRRPRENGCWKHNHSPWVDKGSRRMLWTEEHVAKAVEYVLNGQGESLPEFD